MPPDHTANEPAIVHVRVNMSLTPWGYWWDCSECACAFGSLTADRVEADLGAAAHLRDEHPEAAL